MHIFILAHKSNYKGFDEDPDWGGRLEVFHPFTYSLL